MEALAYRIKRPNGEVLIEGIVENSYSNIYPAQTDNYLVKEFPSLPYECELDQFKVEGLELEIKAFSISWDQLKNL